MTVVVASILMQPISSLSNIMVVKGRLFQTHGGYFCPTGRVWVLCLALTSQKWWAARHRQLGESWVQVPSHPYLSINLLSSFWINTLRFPHVFYVSIFLEYLLAWVILPPSPIYIYSGTNTFKFSEITTSIDIYFLGSKKTLSMLLGKMLFGVWLVKKWRHWNLILVWGSRMPFWVWFSSVYENMLKIKVYLGFIWYFINMSSFFLCSYDAIQNTVIFSVESVKPLKR